MAAEAAGDAGGKLTAGLRVILANPDYDFPCSVCEAVQIGPDLDVQRDPQTGVPLPRWTETPCESCPKVPEWVKAAGLPTAELRSAAAELSPENRKALDHYRRCKATARFPDDPVVQWYAGLIRREEDAAEIRRGQRTADAVTELFGVMMEVMIRRR